MKREVTARGRSLRYLEKLRLSHAAVTVCMIIALLAWGIRLWQEGGATTGDVVLICTLGISILSATRDLAVALVDVTQHVARITEAIATLLQPHELRDHPEAEPLVLSARTSRPALAAEQLMLQEELQREIGPDTDFTGSLLRKVRESQGLELADVSAKTKVARAYLQALEDERFEQLPALVYTRGFLVEFAKQLRLDPTQVQRTYLRRLREEMSVRGKEPA